jgi:predicted TIM-barrel fold metal-dependent hydrolase
MNSFLENIPIVDAHHHLWDLNRNDYPWLSDRSNKHFFLGPYEGLKSNYLPPDYRRDAAHHNVVATVHVEAEWDRDDQVGETRWLDAIADQHGMPDAFVGHAWFDDPNVERVLEAHAAHSRVRGIRSKPARPGQDPHDVDEARGAMSDAQWRCGFALLAKYDLSWDLRVPLTQLPEAAALVGPYTIGKDPR